jgi:hypothetical protein
LPTRLPGGVKLDFSTKKFEFPFSTWPSFGFQVPSPTDDLTSCFCS